MTWACRMTDMSRVEIPNSCVHGGFTYLALGTSSSHYAGVPLPYPLPPSLTRGALCWIQSSPEVLIQNGIWPGPVGSDVRVWIPNDVSLISARVYAQWYVDYWTQLNASCNFVIDRPYIVTSDVAELTLGL
jgi:hypothetical protein